LTDSQLKAWYRRGGPLSGKSDRDGLTFMISSNGTASWKLRCRFAGRPWWLTLGHYPQMSLKEAREKALKERARLLDGVDMVADRRRARIALAKAKTFAERAEDYMKRSAPALATETQQEMRRSQPARRHFGAILIFRRCMRNWPSLMLSWVQRRMPRQTSLMVRAPSRHASTKARIAAKRSRACA
jgi:hypothetical protein